MNGDDVRDEIAQLEERIETLAESIGRCRKLSLAAKLAIAAGAVWIVLVLLSLVPFAPYEIVAALAAMIGGTVLLGSNATTWEQTETALHAAGKARADLIGRIPMRAVGEDSRTIH